MAQTCYGNPNCNPPNSPHQTLESPVVCESLAELADIPQGWLFSSGRARGDPVAVPTAAFPGLASVPARFCSEDLRTATTRVTNCRAVLEGSGGIGLGNSTYKKFYFSLTVLTTHQTLLFIFLLFPSSVRPCFLFFPFKIFYL